MRNVREIHTGGRIHAADSLAEAQRNVCAIPDDRMFGRHTATARHVTDPVNKVLYLATERLR